MCKILLSINPEHVDSIFSGIKKFEYRKVKCRRKIDSILIYSTFPIMKVVGEVEVKDVLIGEPESIWEQTKKNSGIDKYFFENYYKNRNKAVAFCLGSIDIFDHPKSLNDYGINNAPQSFVYI